MRPALAVAAAAALSVLSAVAYMPAADFEGGAALRILGLEEKTSGDGLRVLVFDPAKGPVKFTVETRNSTDKPIAGELSVIMSHDWSVKGAKALRVSLAAKETKRFECEASAVDPVPDGVYAVRASFVRDGGPRDRPVEPVAVFRVQGVAPSAAFAANERGVMPKGSAIAASSHDDFSSRAAKAASAARTALKSGASVRKGTFLLKSARGTCAAAWRGGKAGAIDGVLAFTDGERDFALCGFSAEVDGVGIGVGTNAVACSASASGNGDALEIDHSFASASGTQIVARLSLRAVDGTLRAKWSLPGAKRDAGGHPRFTALSPGAGTVSPERIYFSFGNVYERPSAAFSVQGDGFGCATRHIGADYHEALSLVQVTDLPPDRIAFDPERRFFGAIASGDVEFSFVPSSKGAFDAAFVFAASSGYAKSPGYDRLAGRTCFDIGLGEYANEADELAMMKRAGVRHGVFIKHSWQRWGYDFRFPDIMPPRVSPAEFRRARAAASQADMLFLPHDNYFDYYPDARGFSFDDVLFGADGRPVTACWNGRWRGFAYVWLPGRERDRMFENMTAMKSAFSPDGVFLDVWGMKHPVEWRNRRGEFHPAAETLAAWNESVDSVRLGLGEVDAVIVTEAGADWYVGHCDAGIADHLAPERLVPRSAYAAAARVPWHDAVTHGRMILFGGGCESRYAESEWHKGGDLFAHGYGSDDYISNAAFSGRPACVEGRFTRRTLAAHFLVRDLSAALADSEFKGFEFCGGIHRQHAVFADGETWINRGGDDWEVAGRVLPPYGFYAKAKGVEAGIVKIGGARCAFSFGPDATFVDARPPRTDDSGRTISVRASGARQEGAALRLDLDWTVRKPLSGYVPFVQVVPVDAAKDGTRILHHQQLGIAPAKFAERGRFSTSDLVRIPASLADGKYAMRVGMYFGADDGRWLMGGGEDDLERRVSAGTFAKRTVSGAAKLEWSPESGLPRDPWANERPVKVDFGGIVTDGAFRLVRNGDRLEFTPLLGSAPFTATVGLPNGQAWSITSDGARQESHCP